MGTYKHGHVQKEHQKNLNTHTYTHRCNLSKSACALVVYKTHAKQMRAIIHSAA